ncbi:unnamed protein product [Caenorhabditis auriculariae]|uniref:Peptidase M14 domain-containing protein n=1 Tax=Caenorhabditis auriculariae TaxID=2777116 RepID=A0A8S1GMY2_9PELO|nr:unnamed protein product [Caenorhabditis auriculariae]
MKAVIKRQEAERWEGAVAKREGSGPTCSFAAAVAVLGRLCCRMPRNVVVQLGAVLVVLVITTSSGRTPFFDLTVYNDWPQFEDYVRNVAVDNPAFVQLRQIGKSREGRPLLGLKIGTPPKPGEQKVAVWLDGGNHAREWPAFHVAVYFIDKLVNGFMVDQKITNYLKKLDIYIFPVLNPDGFVFSRTSSRAMIRHWRKNKAPENCTGRTFYLSDVCCDGVDLNRNYDIGFSQNNYPFNNPCSDEYQGPRPFSEPESRAVRDFVMSKEIYGRLYAMVSMHTHGQLWILPYNHHKRTYPEDYKDLEKLAKKAADTVYAYRETQYRIGTAADMLGTATGGATDWVKKNTPTKYVYVLELPPDMKTWFAFQIKPHWLIPIGKETWIGIEKQKGAKLANLTTSS